MDGANDRPKTGRDDPRAVDIARAVAINYEDARWVAGMDLLQHAYLKIVPELEPFFLARSLTTTSSVVAALNSVLGGALTADVSALLGGGRTFGIATGAAISIVSAVLHDVYAARYRQRHAPSK